MYNIRYFHRKNTSVRVRDVLFISFYEYLHIEHNSEQRTRTFPLTFDVIVNQDKKRRSLEWNLRLKWNALECSVRDSLMVIYPFSVIARQ